MPTSLGEVLGDDSIVQDEKKQQEDDMAGKVVRPQDLYSFAEAVESMKLPKVSEVAGKKGAQGANAPANKKKLDIKFTPEQLALEKIDLSGFRTKRFSRSGLKELVEGISLLPCIRTVVLRDNGIGDDCEAEIVELLSNTNIKCIDLSKNNIGPKLAGIIGRKLKDEVLHI